jgi:uncharacterized ion transporter superfamily protein YfcC
LNAVPAVCSAIFVNAFTVFFNFFIVSASSKAAMMMPILAPLGDIINVHKQVLVIAFQYGDGFTNYFWPTSGVVLAGLAMGGNIPWVKWAKWIWKLIVAWTLVSMILTGVAQFMKLGPF